MLSRDISPLSCRGVSICKLVRREVSYRLEEDSGMPQARVCWIATFIFIPHSGSVRSASISFLIICAS